MSLKHVLHCLWLVYSATMSRKHVSVASKTVDMALTKRRIKAISTVLAVVPSSGHSIVMHAQQNIILFPTIQQDAISLSLLKNDE